MNAKKLAQQPVVAITAIAVCALVLPAVASLKNRVTRPVTISGNMMLIVKPTSDNPRIATYEFTDWGQASHAGRYSDTASGTMDLLTGEFLTGSGTIVAANGDTLTWEVTATEDPTDTPNQVVYTGGTGQFQGATGGFTAEVMPATLLGVDPTDGTMALALTYIGDGEITY